MSRLVGPVEIIGVGLLGTSVALACRRAGIDVLLTDVDADHVRTASGLGAGRARSAADRPQLVVVAVPPDHLGGVIASALDGSDAVVTDVGSVKAAPLASLASRPDAGRYVGSHPMAGNERSGPLAASDALFDGRPWAITPHAGSDPAAVALVRELAELCGGVVVELTPAEHDRAVARISHVPHLMAALTAGRLAEAPDGHLALSGQGVRDVTRVAGGDPALYSQIVGGNADAVTELLTEVRDQLDTLIAAVTRGDRATLQSILATGNDGTRAIPAKHGGPARAMRSLFVAVPDEPGSLARLFADAGEIGVNIEDVRIDHDPGRPVGVVELVVDDALADDLLPALESRGWVSHR
ncbi:prephenate dehydrogenase [Nocardioides sp. Kera G14]|uniref:prephenate dehydrogenase n=1 Tax=Nocardioides sp. Kera G14 TaxID=2884264 RepID=UPI001D0F6350|nr:prephenate dehydrogenase [Nocardioides sp. Kera G14]UDY25259.1 prephenate dehydrogenase [Nocardioides sp. Kera G14]